MASSDRPQQRAEELCSSLKSRGLDTEDAPSPRSSKVVTIADPPIESISPLMRGKHKELDQNDSFDLDKAARQFRASVSGKRLSGRPSMERLASQSRLSGDGNPSLSSLISEGSDPSSPRHGHHENLVKQVTEWIKSEKARRAARKAKRKAAHAKHKIHPEPNKHEAAADQVTKVPAVRRGSESEDSEDGSTALEHLAMILERNMSIKSSDSSLRHRKFSSSRKLSAVFKRSSVASSIGEDYFDSIDQLVPSCEAVLDNSKTLAYGAGGPESESTTDVSEKSIARRAKKEKEAWAAFKYEIVRLTHTLRLKSWRRVPLDHSSEITVDRLCGALTNAVYVVSPPKEIPVQEGREAKDPPPKLLLRIYGPQVEHLIDRESELQILRRLARKRIGPRLLGTFTNGRFEEYFHARALTPQELRMPDVSKQIAKRTRELHEGIELLPEEREAGPFVWRNWDKWVSRAEQVVTWLDEQTVAGKQDPKYKGFICGLQWRVFRQTVEKYRVWLNEQYGGKEKVNERLVFAHNDTQYGNILRMTPTEESPLLLPSNEHKQLIVIDFEYSNANLPGLEFANHFTEWCYNYHDPDYSWRCNTSYYPTLPEQTRFISSYLTHNPDYKAPGGSASNPCTPHLGPLHCSGSSTALAACAPPTSISAFMLDSRAPPGEKYGYEGQEAEREREVSEETVRLLAETRLWRLANSAMWVAWGIVQARVPGLPDADGEDGSPKDSETSEKAAESENATIEVKGEAAADEAAEQHDGAADEDEEEEFDYLGYAQDRALFVWGDAIRLGIVKAEELPEELRERVKSVEY